MKFILLIIFTYFPSFAFDNGCFSDRELETFPSVSFEKYDYANDLISRTGFCGNPAIFGEVAMSIAKNVENSEVLIRNLQYQYKYMFQYKAFQIGSNWNRKKLDLTKTFNLEENILAVGDATGVYIGRKGEFGIIATNDHVIRGHSCESLKIEQPTTNLDMKCERIIRFNQQNFDMAFILVRKENIRKVKLDFKKKDKTEFLTAGRGSKNNESQALREESSKLCQSILHTEYGEQTGCDVSHGDSGSPVFDKKSRKLYALINATNSYIFAYTDNEYLRMIDQKNTYSELLKEQSSMVTPFYLLHENIIKSKSLTKEDRTFLNCILDERCIK